MTTTVKTELKEIMKSLNPNLNAGDYVFCVVNDLENINLNEITMLFKEEEGNTIILRKDLADQLKLDYTFIFSRITLTIHSSLSSVGLTALFSKALSEKGISCNVVAAYYHDHIFVAEKDAEEAMHILQKLSQ